MNISIVVHIKSDYATWKEIFDGHSNDRASMADESRTIVGKVSNKKAIVLMYEVDMAKMSSMMEDPDFKKMTEGHVEQHDIYNLQNFPDAIEQMRLAS
jgi:hypothetical protein